MVHIAMLELVRILYGKSMDPTSGCRCRTHNAAIGGAPNSDHICDAIRETCATDFFVEDGADCGRLVDLAIKAGFKKIGINRKSGKGGFVHLSSADLDLPHPIIWTY
jgi:hypothetical protein